MIGAYQQKACIAFMQHLTQGQVWVVQNPNKLDLADAWLPIRLLSNVEANPAAVHCLSLVTHGSAGTAGAAYTPGYH